MVWELTPGRMCRFTQMEREEKGILGRKDSMIKAKDRAKLKTQIICRKVPENKVEKDRLV